MEKRPVALNLVWEFVGHTTTNWSRYRSISHIGVMGTHGLRKVPFWAWKRVLGNEYCSKDMTKVPFVANVSSTFAGPMDGFSYIVSQLFPY